jgi:DinB family protein
VRRTQIANEIRGATPTVHGVVDLLVEPQVGAPQAQINFGDTMEYMKLNTAQREELLASLNSMPEYLREIFAVLTPEQARTPGPDETFSPVEQVWHLADLEREGFGVRIQRLLTEPEPHLPDFDGTKIAAERNYRSLSLEKGILAFTEARRKNIAALSAIDSAMWSRSGTQESVGSVSLCDIPNFMHQHDSAHRAEIEAWKNSFAR